MIWTDPKPPTANQSYYDHVTSETPLGKCIIEWKSWKENPSYDVEINNKWICCVYNLEEAKEAATSHIRNKYEEFRTFLGEVK